MPRLDTYVADRGFPPFHPAMMVALLLYSYTQGVFSSRKIAKACLERMDFAAVTGFQKPDFRMVKAESEFAEVVKEWLDQAEITDMGEDFRFRKRQGGGRGAQFEADRARRQYDVVEPENRLVARTVERAWEEKLRALREIEEAFERHQRQAPAVLTEAERNRIRKVVEDLPGLWNAETTTPADRKAIVRELIDQVVVLVVGESERVQITTHWAGGYHTEMEARRPVRSLAHNLRKLAGATA